MRPSRIMHETVTVIRPGAYESRGTTEPDWTNAATHELKGVSVQEKDGASDMNGRDAAASMATMYAPKGADVLRGDRVKAHGKTWTVTGEPRQMGVGLALQHTAVTLQEWEG